MTQRSQSFARFLEPFARHPQLQQRVQAVLDQLPESVVEDFLSDHQFTVTLDNYVPGKGWSLWMGMPGKDGPGSRAVVLREKLDGCNEDFALYIIAHEFAHAHLYNGGWDDISDPEDAADALAASWGFPKVPRPPM